MIKECILQKDLFKLRVFFFKALDIENKHSKSQKDSCFSPKNQLVLL